MARSGKDQDPVTTVRARAGASEGPAVAGAGAGPAPATSPAARPEGVPRLPAEAAAEEAELVVEDTGAEQDEQGDLLGVEVDGLRGRKPGQGGAEETADELGAGPPSDPRERLQQGNPFRPDVVEPGVDAPDAAEAGVFDLLDQPGAADGDPLTSFLGAVEGKLGRETGLTGGADQGNASPAHGLHSAARGKDTIGPDTLEEFEARNGVFIGPQEPARSLFDRAFMPNREKEEQFGPYAPDDDEAPDEDDHDANPVTGEADPPHDPPPAPHPDDTGDIPDEIGEELTAQVARFRRHRRDTGDGTTDPSEIEGEVVGPASALPDHAEQGQALFGQPPADGLVGSADGGGNLNPGADSQGAGVVTPGEDQDVATGAGREDDPFAGAAPEVEPPVGADEADAAFAPIVPSEAAGPVDDGPDLPDAIDP